MESLLKTRQSESMCVSLIRVFHDHLLTVLGISSTSGSLNLSSNSVPLSRFIISLAITTSGMDVVQTIYSSS